MTDNSKSKVTCTKCPKEFDTLNDMMLHKFDVHKLLDSRVYWNDEN